MVFSSILFLFGFLPLVLLVYFPIPSRFKNLCLTLFSYVFYGWSNPLFVPVMAASTIIDYVCALRIAAHPVQPSDFPSETPASILASRRRRWLILSLCTNLGLLGFFKYFNFGIDTVKTVLAAFGHESALADWTLRVTLPLGISFYTFQSMSYTIDVYRGKVEPTRNFIDFACFVSLFPQLVAGPIVRYADLAQALIRRTVTVHGFARGVALLSVGLAKKIILANPCGKIADVVFNAQGLDVWMAWWGAVAYAFQIYFDFSGYSDMAIGLGMMFGFSFPTNFDSPYRSQSITEFWRRWHMSLSSWLRDYLYVSLGGNRLSPMKTYRNLMLVMLLGGLWHGAAWTFVVWGGLHGLWLAVERAAGKRPIYAALPKPFRIGLTFFLVTLGWVMFRSPNFSHALRYYGALFGLSPVSENIFLIYGMVARPWDWLVMGICALIVWTAPASRNWVMGWSPWKAVVCAGLFVFSVAILLTQGYNPFIYFIF
uniref:MBOAT family protein n=1 Tax=Desulfatirhabdium butyrativorans TaxID=340467 RepID=A0A7C4RS81_9BACT